MEFLCKWLRLGKIWREKQSQYWIRCEVTKTCLQYERILLVLVFAIFCSLDKLLIRISNVVQDKALAELAIEDKRREIESAEKYLEDALQSALNTPSE